MSTKLNPDSEVQLASWDYRPVNRYIEIRIRRNTAIAILVSLVVHGVVLFVFAPRNIVEASSVAKSFPKTISVRIAGLPPKKTFGDIKPQKQNVKAKQKSTTLPVIAVEKHTNASPQSITTFSAENNAPKDLMSYVKAKKQYAQDLEDYAARENENAHVPTEEELRDANIQRNLQQPGTSGIFEIRKKAISTAQFSLKGWKNDGSIPRLEIIDVEVSAGGNIELAIVKRMIEIIRREYKGDFNWESQRLGRIIVLSARMEDNTGLEAFLMQEFFAVHGY